MRRFLVRMRWELSPIWSDFQPNSVTHTGFQPFLGLKRRMMLLMRLRMSYAISSLCSSSRRLLWWNDTMSRNLEALPSAPDPEESLVGGLGLLPRHRNCAVGGKSRNGL